MEITKEQLFLHGFQKVNNSMFRRGDIVLQYGYKKSNGSVLDVIFSSEKCFNVYIKGKYKTQVQTINKLRQLL